MTEKLRLHLLRSNIQHHDSVYIDVYGLVPNNELPALVASVVDTHLDISNVQLILEFNEELVLVNVLLAKSKDVESQFLALAVGQDVEISGLALELDVLDQAYVEQVVDVYLRMVDGVDVKTVLSRGNDEDVLSVMHIEDGGLSDEGVLELHHCLDVSKDRVHDENFVLVCEEEA